MRIVDGCTQKGKDESVLNKVLTQSGNESSLILASTSIRGPQREDTEIPPVMLVTTAAYLEPTAEYCNMSLQDAGRMFNKHGQYLDDTGYTIRNDIRARSLMMLVLIESEEAAHIPTGYGNWLSRATSRLLSSEKQMAVKNVDFQMGVKKTLSLQLLITLLNPYPTRKQPICAGDPRKSSDGTSRLKACRNRLKSWLESHISPKQKARQPNCWRALILMLKHP